MMFNQCAVSFLPMDFIESIKTCFTKYVDFNGRARRSEYWWFYLFCNILIFALTLINDGLGTIGQLAVLLPGIAAGVRRMHDTNHSGWYLLIPIYNLILACTRGDETENEYGPSPYNMNNYIEN